jgi:chemotaxis signal transduction protein
MLYLIFKAGEKQYALETTRVLRVVPCVKLRPAANAPACIAGLLNFHGRPVAVVDLGKLINQTPCQRLLGTRIIITEQARPKNEQLLLGLLAEDIATIMEKDNADLTENARGTPGTKYLGKMFRDNERLVQIVKAEEIAATAEIQVAKTI